jgi:hypothetical protein
MYDAFDRVLQLVADGRLTAEEAAPLLDALDDRARASSTGTYPTDRPGGRDPDAPASAVRIEVTDAGRPVVNLRVPLALGRSALNYIPGVSEATAERVREAISAGIKGSILDVDDGDGDGVRVVIE